MNASAKRGRILSGELPFGRWVKGCAARSSPIDTRASRGPQRAEARHAEVNSIEAFSAPVLSTSARKPKSPARGAGQIKEYPQLHDELRRQRKMLAALEQYASWLSDRHAAWKVRARRITSLTGWEGC